jgi:dethiobiotin synthetase
LRGLFVTGTGTEVGKTVLSACLVAAIRAAGEDVRASKPVLTGTAEPPDSGWPADDAMLARATGMRVEEVTALRFGPAVSPHLAAELEERPIDPDELLSRVRETLSGADSVVVEGVGGLLVPIAGAWSVRDLAAALALPLIVAARPGLGTISHTLLTLEAARSVGLEVRAVVLTPWPERPSEIERSNRETIARLGDVAVTTLPLVSRPEPADLARAGATLPWREWLGDARSGP